MDEQQKRKGSSIMKKSTTALHRVTKERFPMSGYKFTVTHRNDPAVKALKENVKIMNSERGWGTKMRVRLMGRGPRAIWARADGRHPRAYDCYLPLDKATHYDVYVNDIDAYYSDKGV